MKTKDFAALGKKLLTYMPGFTSKGMLVFAQPISHVIRGLHFDGSSHNPKSFYIYCFFQPLCVPISHLHFTFGFRLRNMEGIDGWSSDDPRLLEKVGDAIATKAMPFLNGAATLEDAAVAAEAMQPSNPHVMEAAAYCRALSGDLEGALSSLDALDLAIDRKITWQATIADRANMLGELLKSDPGEARKRLLEWELETVQNVGLGAFWSKRKQ